MINGWINIYKPRGISSAKAVSLVKRSFPKTKIGHAGTLDLEAEGVLPLALGEATKLISLLVDARKEYVFKVEFGAKTDTGDSSGKIVATTHHFPTRNDCEDICAKFIGKITQTPPSYSAIKINGVRAYTLARQNQEVTIPQREIYIYNINLEAFDSTNNQATFRAECSKGTYIRTLAEDISLSLQSLGFVVKLCRTKVGKFTQENSVDITSFVEGDWQDAKPLLSERILKLEEVLDDIPVLNVDGIIAHKVKCGQKLEFDLQDTALICLKYNDMLIAIGKVHNKSFKSLRVLNII